ncbi:MAG: tyrosine-type recombinase/integrase [Nevskia sp.]|nr:tyrosine-type recombinase/integrase [Nevskia sp.]
MCAARRRPQNRGLPRNLTTHPKGFRYKHPLTRKYVYLGKDVTRAEAIEAAERLNLQFAPRNRVYDRLVGDSSLSVRRLIELHLASLSSDDADKTKADRKWEFGKLSRELGSLDASEVNTHFLANYLRNLQSDHRRRRYRARLVELFDTAVYEGWRDDNPARILRAYKPKTRRERLTHEAFLAIRAVAPDWLQNAMDLGLQTLQRREDLVQLRWSDVEDDRLKIEQGKTGRRLAIAIGAELREVLQRCRDRIASPYVLHRLPEKARPVGMRASARDHFTQILPEQLTRAFSDAFELARLPVEAERTRPTFHEIRSLGMALYREQGWSEERIQALAGHADVTMTRHYLEGHDAPWQPVDSGLSIGRKRY